MRKLICLTIIICFLCGCTNESKNFSLNINSLNTTFSSKTDDFEVSGNISFDKNMNMVIEIKSPQNISGLTFNFNDNNISTSFGNVSNTYNFSDLPENFAFADFYCSLKKAITNGGFVRNSESSYEATYDGIKIIADKEGNITSATLKNGYILFNK